VFVVEDGRAVARKVELGERNADYAEVRGGLEVGTIVIVHPADTVTNGSAVSARTAPP
jgi:HlyD family secretion protein